MSIDPEALARHEQLIFEKLKSESQLKAKAAKPVQVAQQANKPFSLAAFSLTGRSEKMKAKLLDEKHVLKDLVVLGEFASVYAPPNAGKTLLVLWQLVEAIRDGVISGDAVFYINADDNFSGLTFKTIMAEEHGFHMLSPGHRGFDAKSLAVYLKQMIASGTAYGSVIVLDTMKKFTRTMDKETSADFMVRCREFVTNGGTIIALGHVNKNRDAEGKLVYAGTTDIVDDGDCTFMLEKINETGTTRTVLFENIKMRGNVARELAFSYSIADAASYQQRFDSVSRMTKEDLAAATKRIETEVQLSRDQYVINAITEAIRVGHAVKGELVKYVQQETAMSRRPVIAALDRYQGVKWVSETKSHGAKLYTLITRQATVRESRDAKKGKFH